MKKVLSLFLSCIFVLGVCFSTPIVASAADVTFTSEGVNEKFTYKVLEGQEDEKPTCALTNYTYTGTGNDPVNVVITQEVQYNNQQYRITEIVDGAFAKCSAVKAFKVSQNEHFSIVDDVLFNSERTKLIAYPAAKVDGEGKKVTEYVIPEGVKEIATGAFADSDVIIVSDNTEIANPDGLIIHQPLATGVETHDVKYAISGVDNIVTGTCSCGVVVGTYAKIILDNVNTIDETKWAMSVTIDPNDGYLVSNSENEGFSNEPIKFNENIGCTADGSLTFFLKEDVDGAEVETITIDLGVKLDTTVPTATITLDENNSWDSLGETTFGLFYKEPKTVTITSADEYGSGIASIEYCVSEKAIENVESANVDWEVYASPITLSLGSKNIVYAKITDNVGNVKYISSNGIVLYSDSEADTESFEITYKSNENKDVTVKLNGNTINSVICDKGEFGVSNYTVDSDKIILKGEYLEKLSYGEYTYTVSYNPLGVDFVSGTNNSVPATTEFKVIVNKADITGATLPEAKTGLVYDGSEQSLVSAGSIEEGTVQYRLSENEDWSNTVPTGDNAGDYTVYYKISLDENYNDITGSIPVTIAEAASSVATAPTANELTYTGSAQALVTAGEATNGTMQYKLGETGDWNTEIPTGTDAGTYKVYYKVVGDPNYSDAEEVLVNVTITKATPTVTAPTAITGLVYNGGEQELVNAGTANSGVLEYSLDNETWSEDIPEGLEAGEYTVYYRVGITDNYNGVDGNVNVTIAPKTIDVSLIKESYKYDGSHHILTFKFTNADDENDVTLNGGYEVKTYKNDTLVNLLIDVGEYKVVVTLEENSNYTFINAEGQQVREKELTYTITKGVASITTAPTVNGNLVYSGVAQELVTAGSVNGGTIYYTMTPDVDNSWSTEIPKETNAGTYDVYYKVVGDTNHSDSEVESVTVTVAEKTLTDGAVSVENGEYTGSEIKPEVVVKDGETKQLIAGTDYEVYYSNNINAGGGAKVTVTFKGNYTGTVEKTFTINKATPKAENFIFTEPKNLNYDGGAKTATVVVKDGITGMGDVTVKYYDSEGNEVTPKAEGTYTVKINIEEGTNFNAATEITRDNWKFTINEHEHDWKYSASGATITATCQNGGCDINETIKLEVNAPENLVYDGGKKEVTYTITEGYEELFDEATISYIGDCVDAGNYTAYVEIGDATARLSFEISKAVIVVTKVTATNRVYNGTLAVEIDKDADIEFTGLASGDKVSFDLSALKGTLDDANAGEKNKVVTITGSIVLTGEDAGNYWVSTPKTTTVKITPATLTITPDAKSSEQYYDLPALTYKVTGLIGSDKLTKEPTLTTNADIKTVGNYTITATGAEASANYKITYAPATLTITEHKNHIVKDGTWKETVHGTCMVVGKEAGTCTLCSGTVTRDSKIDPNNHALITTVTKKETCTQNGEALVTCANGCSYSLKTTLPADGELHNFAEDFTVIESTCVAKGSKYKVCQNPGCKVVSEKTEIAINPDAHKNIVTVNAKDATCETKGYTGDKVCNDCKKTTDPGIEINAKGHTESDWIIDKEPTFTEEGAKHTACTVCKKELKKEVIAKRALEVPEVKIENASNGIKVSWSQDEDATGYTVYSSTYNASTKKWSSWKNRGTAAATKSSWTDKTVTEGVTYRYTVRSVNGTNKSNYKATSGLCYVVAPKVTVSITSTGLLAKWNKVNNATSYIVYRRALVNGVWSSWVNLGSTKAEKNTWSDTSVQSGVTYRYTVRAVVGKVKSGYTASSSIIYLAQPLLKISNANTGITGKWDPIAGATGYTIYRSEYNPSTKKWSKWLTLGTTGATAKTFTDKTVKSGYEYKYTIRAVSGKFKSTYQDSNKLVYLAQPTLKISNVANGIQGKWSQVNGATGYIIYRRELKDGKWSNWTSLGTTKSTAKTFTDKTVKSGVTYKYTIRAKNGSYKSSYVSTGSLVFLSVPTVKISNGITGVNVSWSKIEGATSYLVYRRELVDGKWTKWAEFKTVSETSLVDETVKSGTNYRYTVRALNGKSSSMYTSTGTLYYLTAPTVTVEKVDGVVKVNWTQTVGAKGYTIYRAELGADGKWSKWVTLGTATEKYSSCKDKTAKTGVTYKYTVRAVNGKVKSAYVDGAQITNQ